MKKKYSHYIQNKLEKVKSTASQFISSKSEVDNYVLELTPITYEKLKHISEKQQTTIQTLVSHIVDQYVTAKTAEAKNNISIERKERNPLLYLEAICQQHD